MSDGIIKVMDAAGDGVIEILDALAKKLGIMIDWTSENVTPYLYELFERFIAWEIWTSVFYLGIGILLLVAGFILCKFEIKIFKDMDEELAILMMVPTGICLFLGVFIAFIQIHDIITCLTFPEIMLVEYISQYVNAQ